MVVSLSNIPDGSLVKHFITAGHRGRCGLCSKFVEKLEAHHVCYSPESTIKLCHNCHHRVHFWPTRLEKPEIIILLQKRFTPRQTQKIINDNLGIHAIARLIAPSRAGFLDVVNRKVY